MASRTLVNGTGYDIKNGRTLVNGTGYSIKKGRTLVDGTGYDILLNRYQLAPWTGSDGDKHVTVQSRWWSEIRKGLTVQHTLSATVSGNTNEKAQSGFRLTGLQAGDTVELTYSCETTASGSFYIDFIAQADDAESAFEVSTPSSTTRTASGTAVGEGMLFYITAGRYNSRAYSVTLHIYSLKVNGEQII